jgi:hypothetical protein
MVLVGISYDVRYTRKRCDLFGGTLCVTAGDNNFTKTIVSPNAADGCPCVLFGGGSYRAGIKDNPVCLSYLSSTLKSQLPKLLLNRSAVSLSSAATEIFYVKAGHRSILAYIHLRMGNCRTPLYV